MSRPTTMQHPETVAALLKSAQESLSSARDRASDRACDVMSAGAALEAARSASAQANMDVERLTSVVCHLEIHVEHLRRATK
jgi:hypothetical protein